MKIIWGLLIGLCIGSQASVINAANTCVAPPFGRPQMGTPMGTNPTWGMNPAMATYQQPYRPNMAGPGYVVPGQMGPVAPQGRPVWGMPNNPGGPIMGPQQGPRVMMPQGGPGMMPMMPQAPGMTPPSVPSSQIKCFKLNPDGTSTPLDPQTAATEQKELNAVSTCVATCQANSSFGSQPNAALTNPQIQCYKVNPDGTFTPIDPLRAAAEQAALNAVSTCVANCQSNKGCADANCPTASPQQQTTTMQQDSGVQIVYADTTGATSLQQPTTPDLPRHGRKASSKTPVHKATHHDDKKSAFHRSIEHLKGM